MFNNIIPKKRFGQNFLLDKNVRDRIISMSNIKKSDIVLEIGPGKGFITEEILKKADFLISIEIDKDLVHFLKHKFVDCDNFFLEEGNCLDIDFFSFKKLPNKLIANIPYNITTDIIFKILKNYDLFNTITIMIQEEVADRIISKHNSKNYGSISCILQTFYYIEKFASLSPNVFYPRPKVRSALLLFSKKFQTNNFLIKKDVLNLYLIFVQFCFFERRKIFLNYFKKNFLEYFFKKYEQIINSYNLKYIDDFFIKNNLDFNVRPENLSCDEFIKLFCYLFYIEKIT